jgi:hypothetical protein
MTKLLSFTSVITFLFGFWLAVMECVLHQPGFASRAAIALLIAAAGLVTLFVLVFHPGVSSERWLWAAAAALIGLGVYSFLHNARAAHFEGFVFIISIVLVVQGLLMLATLGRQSGPGRAVGASS